MMKSVHPSLISIQILRKNSFRTFQIFCLLFSLNLLVIKLYICKYSWEMDGYLTALKISALARLESSRRTKLIFFFFLLSKQIDQITKIIIFIEYEWHDLIDSNTMLSKKLIKSLLRRNKGLPGHRCYDVNKTYQKDVKFRILSF